MTGDSDDVRVLAPPDRDDFITLTARNPVVNVFADHRARMTNLDERWLGGQVWGRFRDGELVAGCHVAANVVPVECTLEDARAFAAVARAQRWHIGNIVGPHEAVEAMWRALEPDWPGRPREERWVQPHLEISSPATVPASPDVRPTTPADLDVLYPACVAMYTEEVGVSPESEGGGPGLYRARVQQLISRGWSFASFDDDGVVFKAEVACATPHAAQVQGVWVRPDRRGEGLGRSGMAAVVEQVLSDIAPVVSLYVNDWNAPARAAYERVGFTRTATFSTLMF